MVKQFKYLSKYTHGHVIIMPMLMLRWGETMYAEIWWLMGSFYTILLKHLKFYKQQYTHDALKRIPHIQ